ncbi:MAG: hypothetical protein ACREBR_04275 [bacterium]
MQEEQKSISLLVDDHAMSLFSWVDVIIAHKNVWKMYSKMYRYAETMGSCCSGFSLERTILCHSVDSRSLVQYYLDDATPMKYRISDFDYVFNNKFHKIDLAIHSICGRLCCGNYSATHYYKPSPGNRKKAALESLKRRGCRPRPAIDVVAVPRF